MDLFRDFFDGKKLQLPLVIQPEAKPRGEEGRTERTRSCLKPSERKNRTRKNKEAKRSRKKNRR